jgi:hypothetical protein
MKPLFIALFRILLTLLVGWVRAVGEIWRWLGGLILNPSSASACRLVPRRAAILTAIRLTIRPTASPTRSSTTSTFS